MIELTLEFDKEKSECVLKCKEFGLEARAENIQGTLRNLAAAIDRITGERWKKNTTRTLEIMKRNTGQTESTDSSTK